MPDTLAHLSSHLMLGELLGAISKSWGAYELLDSWSQGEFHHDVVLRLSDAAAAVAGAPGRVLVVATNCNGGVKEILSFDEVPDRWALWHHRCPLVGEFSGTLPPLRDSTRTVHWFDPCALLTTNARSELKPEHRRRQRGGGWEAT